MFVLVLGHEILLKKKPSLKFTHSHEIMDAVCVWEREEDGERLSHLENIW